MEKARTTAGLALSLLLSCLGTARAEEQLASDLAARRDQCHADYRAQLQQLADACDRDGLENQAAFTRGWLPQRDPLMLYVFALPQSSAPPTSLMDGDAARQWWDRFTKLRHDQADKLFELAEQASQAKQPALALELARETVRENPDHERGRAVLGYERFEDRWVTRETARRLKAGQVWSNRFGWLPADHVPRYEKGERFYRGRWIDADEDARLHANIKSGWHVETDHFNVTTNHSLEEGVRLAEQLETLYEVWRQAFAGYYTTPEEVQRWFASGQPQSVGPGRKLYQVVHFRDRNEYIQALKSAQPQIEISLGTYLDDAKTAYFFAGEDQSAGTLFHEATHQLFRETRPASVDPGRKNNFWIVEAVACYMESLAPHDLLPGEPYGRYHTVGGANEGRVPAARKRLVDDDFYVPLRELAPLGMLDLQSDQRLRPIYSQISGLALFLMHADHARYRQPLMNYLIALYTGRADSNTLEKLTGRRYEDLDQQYRAFIE